MPWEKQFDVDKALERAKETFWARGYEATSMELLLKRMGINRGSFYDTFRSKRDVLVKALRQYDAHNRASLLRAAAQGKPPREAIATVFRCMIDGSRGRLSRHGCLLVNSALEMAPKDKEVAQIVRSGFKDIEKFFAELVRQGQEAGEIHKRLNAAETGSLLMNQMVGLMVLVRARAPKTVLDSVVAQAERMLE